MLNRVRQPLGQPFLLLAGGAGPAARLLRAGGPRPGDPHRRAAARHVVVGDLPGVPGDILQTINDRLQQALPEFFASLPGNVRLRTADTGFRPVATAVAPTGMIFRKTG